MSLDPQAFCAEVKESLRAADDLTVPAVRRFRRTLSKRLMDAEPRAVLGIAQCLLKNPGPMERFVAYELVAEHRAAMRSLGPVEIEQLAADFQDWAAVDTFGCYLSGPAWRDGQIPESLIAEWASRNDRWWRRAALVSTVALGRRGAPGDTERTLRICSALAVDRDDMVVKALSWALRELTKTDAPAVRRFLAENDPPLAARAIREVRNKLESGLKNPKRR